MKRLKWMLMAAGVALAMSVPARALPIVMFNLDPPDGQLAGAAGSSVGWAFTITADSDFVTIQSITFGETSPVGVFGTPGLVLSAASPGSAIVVPWILNLSGLQYDIDPGALLGFATQGLMTLVYDTYSDAGLTDQIGFSDTVNASFGGSDVTAQVTVNQGGVVVTPEPGGLVVIGLGMLMGWRRLRRG